MNFPNERHDWDGLRAGAILRWLEQSGPRYRDVNCVFILMGDGWAKVRVTDPGNGICAFTPQEMSLASWQICLQSKRGDIVMLKIRIDALALAPIAA